ncbi:hypothetical protein Tco_0014238 [Tanacetum coccineum]
MTTRNVGRRTAATRGAGISKLDGQEGERFEDQAGSESYQGSQGSSRGNGANGGGGGVADFATIIAQQFQNQLPTIVAQVGNHVNNQGNNGNQDDNIINDNNQGNDRTVNLNNDRGGCSYKEFMACNLKDYDEKGGAIVYTHWIEKMESVQDISGCGENQKVKYTADSLIVSFRAEIPDTVELCVMAVRFRNSVQEAIRSQRRVIDHLEEVKDCPTLGWLERLEENHDEESECLKMVNALVDKLCVLVLKKEKDVSDMEY